VEVVAINYDDAKFLNNEDLFITKPMLKEFEKKFPWAAVGDCSVGKTGEVFCYFSRKVYVDK